jgi:hypothetical protein
MSLTVVMVRTSLWDWTIPSDSHDSSTIIRVLKRLIYAVSISCGHLTQQNRNVLGYALAARYSISLEETPYENRITGVRMPSSVGLETRRPRTTIKSWGLNISVSSMQKCEITHCPDTCRFSCAHEPESARIPVWVATLPAPGIGAHCTEATLRAPA